MKSLDVEELRTGSKRERWESKETKNKKDEVRIEAVEEV